MELEQYKKIAYGAWYEHVSLAVAKKQHGENIKKCQDAIDYHNQQKRPTEILVLHGSQRSSFKSSAQELSNSQLLLNSAIEQFKGDLKYNLTEVRLRDYWISFCNGCYATSSALCGFPCNCFPLDPMQELYPLVLKCDVMLISTPVNQSAMSGMLKAFCDRLISLDGGFFVSEEQYAPKDADWRDKCIALGLKLAKNNDLHYDARMWGRVAAYFITSKDQENDMKTASRPDKPPLNYIELVAWSLKDGFADYGFFHADPWYVGAAADPNQELCLDKSHFEKHEEYREKAAKVALAAVKLADKLRDDPPKFDGGARKNRT
jgi:multimeric flavodoxin WrbA